MRWQLMVHRRSPLMAEATAEFRAYSAHATAVERAENGIKKIVANVEDARAYLAAVAAGDIVEVWWGVVTVFWG